ncbi:Transcription factor Adf-1 [Cyphomyrmex costatus]|uniref:Transcription factor Adf-1 n=1 Tax=Cyphomyrmex costatus TaxID=456900 RepID=A0A151I7E0_9HYME|nr:Transcription factor Adf-1 [Cyphomyrmex costatus]
MTDDHTYPDNFSYTFESRLAEESVDDVGEFIETFDELVIACVQSYTHLYNKKDKNYKDHLMKEQSWKKIAKTCNVSVDEVQYRWKRLKDRYTKERRLNENATRSGSGKQQNKQWPLFESMKSLEKHIQRRRYRQNLLIKN